MIPLPSGALDAEAATSVHWWQGDLRSPSAVHDAIEASAPEAIFHLAGIAHIPSADADPAGTLDVNVIVAARLLGDVRTRLAAGTLDPVVVVVGSGEQYGSHDAADLPLVRGSGPTTNGCVRGDPRSRRRCLRSRRIAPAACA